jgi:chromosome segregation ATPase
MTCEGIAGDRDRATLQAAFQAGYEAGRESAGETIAVYESLLDQAERVFNAYEQEIDAYEQEIDAYEQALDESDDVIELLADAALDAVGDCEEWKLAANRLRDVVEAMNIAQEQEQEEDDAQLAAEARLAALKKQTDEFREENHHLKHEIATLLDELHDLTMRFENARNLAAVYHQLVGAPWNAHVGDALLKTFRV